MRYFCLAIILFFSLIINSCATQTGTLKSLITAKKSFVKIETLVKFKTCQPNEDPSICDPYMMFSSGSGMVIFYQSRKAILTAAHVCKVDEFDGMLGPLKGSKVALRAIDRDNKEFFINVIKYDVDLDICLLDANDLPIKALNISSVRPVYGDRVYNISAPVGIADGEMVPLYEGFFFGESEGRAFYSIPTIGGSSGSAILNIKGELVGMIHSVHYRFHHISLSVTHRNLWNFVNSSYKNTSESLNMCLHSDSEQSQIEESLPHIEIDLKPQ
tara:strand:- start:45 stop:860 length:816 start_codon:yes stop_codon:yes gene_type:complete